MKPIVPPLTDVGVVIARFQTHELHPGQIDLIQTVVDRHERVIIFLGVSTLRNTRNNPLGFKERVVSVKELFPNVEIYEIKDNRSNEVWSRNLDSELRNRLIPFQTATLYGSRDSFLKAYSGNFPTCELMAEINISASEVRRKLMNNYHPSKDFRAGMIAATGMRYPTAYQTVDIAIIKPEEKLVLLAKKPGEKQWRFIGGFSDPASESLEQDARREAQEETGVSVNDPVYLGSTKVPDWRYRSEMDCIKTAFFVATYMFGKAEAADDIAECEWFPYSYVVPENIVPEHVKLVEMFQKKVSGV